MRTKSRRLGIELLEGREVPAAVFSVFSNGALFLLGSTQTDSITVSQAGPNQVTITPGAGTTIDGSAGSVTRPVFGALVIRMGAGNDTVNFDLSNGITLPGSLVVDYGTAGTGTKTTTTTNAGQFELQVRGGLGIRYAAGDVTTRLDNLRVLGGMTVTHAAGDSSLRIDNVRGAGLFSAIGGGLMVTNAQGKADNTLLDTNVGGSVTFGNGKARAADNAAGSTTISNANNTARAIIGGTLVISNLSGDSTVGNTVGDVIVRGGVAMNLGSGQFKATVADVKVTDSPVSIGGSLTIRGALAGQHTVALGGAGTGLRVGGNVSVALGGRDASVAINDLTVGMATAIATGAGADVITIDGAAGAIGSSFNGAFAVRTGAGADSLTINGGSATTSTTTFRGAVGVNLGADNDTLTVATAGKVRFLTPASLPVTFGGGLGTNTKSVTVGNVTGHKQAYVNF